MLAKSRFNVLSYALKTELTRLRARFRVRVMDCLLARRDDLRKLSEAQLEQLAEILDGLCTHDQLLKAYRKDVPAHVARALAVDSKKQIRVIMTKTWDLLSPGFRKMVSDPRSIVRIRVRNTVRSTRVEDLTPAQLVRIIMDARPHTEPPCDYYHPAGWEKQGGSIILAGTRARPLGGISMVKIRFHPKDLERYLNEFGAKKKKRSKRCENPSQPIQPNPPSQASSSVESASRSLPPQPQDTGRP